MCVTSFLNVEPFQAPGFNFDIEPNGIHKFLFSIEQFESMGVDRNFTKAGVKEVQRMLVNIIHKEISIMKAYIHKPENAKNPQKVSDIKSYISQLEAQKNLAYKANTPEICRGVMANLWRNKRFIISALDRFVEKV